MASYSITFTLCWLAVLALVWLAGALWHWLVQVRRQARAGRAVRSFRNHYS